MKFTETHEWVEAKEGIGTVGITDYAQKELGDIVFVELPEVGKTIERGREAAVLESTKAAADVYSPISGEIVAVNEQLIDSSELINSSPEHEGWIFKVRLSKPEELDQMLDQDSYQGQLQ